MDPIKVINSSEYEATASAYRIGFSSTYRQNTCATVTTARKTRTAPEQIRSKFFNHFICPAICRPFPDCHLSCYESSRAAALYARQPFFTIVIHYMPWISSISSVQAGNVALICSRTDSRNASTSRPSSSVMIFMPAFSISDSSKASISATLPA